MIKPLLPHPFAVCWQQRLCAFLISLFLMTGLAAQRADSTLCLGRLQTLTSDVLGESRDYWLYVSPTLCADSPYHVIYLLDGENFFPSVVSFSRFFGGSRVAQMLPCVVVGVVSGDRTRDFTPTRSSRRRDGTFAPDSMAAGGGAMAFLRFLTEELRPAVEQQLGSVKSRTLMGHSYGGLFALTSLFAMPAAFDDYVAIDPSLWWDGGYILQRMAAVKSFFSSQRTYVAFATKPRPESKYVQFQMTNQFEDTLLPLLKQQGLNIISRRFPTEVHGTVALPGFYDAMKWLFGRQ